MKTGASPKNNEANNEARAAKGAARLMTDDYDIGRDNNFTLETMQKRTQWVKNRAAFRSPGVDHHNGCV
ncbi:hypothetical protein M0D69_24505 [Caballeronia sp. SEWSISQ10-4 2]|uniref:hypothetical protein n=1 Tax=Caballeronia sp. SEWSISQ10-4 2 TaxID=2937438 RepID=UPI00264B83E5|nr:hypothetical protein [Caballeronia sp. SEWSISQ10-4 2]MDN7181094.1 hypothetical protein [Caballeronia sp. SEWSISQ10-4 2]